MKSASRKTAFFIAKRYVVSRKKHNIINVISIVSMVGIMVCTAALVIVLSVFNGLEETISGWFNDNNPDFMITLREGKSFETAEFPMEQLRRLDGVSEVDEMVSDLALVTYQDRQELLQLIGVDTGSRTMQVYADVLVDGDARPYYGEQACANLGTVAAGKLLVNLKSYDMLKVYYPKRTKKNLADPASAFNTDYLYPTGVFASNTDHDQNYLVCPIEFARNLMHYQEQATSMAVYTNLSADVKKMQKEIESIVGPSFVVKNQQQQEETLFKTMQSEKLVTYIILAFILFVAAFNIIGAIGMLVLEKQRDNAILYSLGASPSLIQRIFLYEGMAVSLIGGILGIIIGVIVCWMQQTFHLIKLGGGDGYYTIPYYPVQMHFTDILLILMTILFINLITAILPAHALKKSINKTSEI
ncbi:MAG: FtsX-like permease family protein [Bacteroidales bacterium]|nr:FtsX-like permease family protein [Bacteroidales bacterium]